MDARYQNNLRLWDGGAMALVPDMPGGTDGLPASCSPGDVAEQLFAREALDAAPAKLAHDAGAEPYTLQWFLNVEKQRHRRQGRWIPRLLEFARHSGETLLGLGHGLGTDWLQYARHGATVVVCSSSAQQLALTRRNFELRGLGGRFVHAMPASLPLEGASIDVACLTSLLDETVDAATVVQEVYRVLKPGGKVLAVAPARFDVDFWTQAWFYWPRIFWPKYARTATPRVKYSGRQLRRLFGRFVEYKVYKRQLRRSEVPHIWRWLPLSLLERIMGHVVILKAFKPLSAAMPLQAAA